MSNIEWTEKTWNPVVGCSKVSEGCRNCYAMKMAHRLSKIATTADVYEGLTVKRSSGAEWTGQVRCLPERLTQPLRWRKPRRVFVCSMSDLFHVSVPRRFQKAVFGVMAATPRHTYQVLTKRALGPYVLSAHLDASERLMQRIYPQDSRDWRIRNLLQAHALNCGAKVVSEGSMPSAWPLLNVWIGASIENDSQLKRVEDLRLCPAAVRFLSLEPLLGPLSALDLSGIDWVIVGSESGPGRRPARLEWVREIRDQCIDQGVAFFFKQWHIEGRKVSTPELDGRTWTQYPEVTT